MRYKYRKQFVLNTAAVNVTQVQSVFAAINHHAPACFQHIGT